jgi:hypothetical protein
MPRYIAAIADKKINKIAFIFEDSIEKYRVMLKYYDANEALYLVSLLGW